MGDLDMFKRVCCWAVTLFLACILGPGLPETVFAAKSVPVNDVEFFADDDGRYDFETVSAPAFAAAFQPYPHRTISLGITKTVYWLRFRIPPRESGETAADSQFFQLDNPNIDRIDLYVPQAKAAVSGAPYLAKAVGVSRPAANREIWDNTWVFFVPSDYRQEQYWYLRLESSSALRMSAKLWRGNTFFTEALYKNMGFGLFYGILTAMLLFNLFTFFVLRDKAYFYYVLYLAFMLLYQLQVHGYLRLWLDLPYRLYNAVFWLWLAGAFMAAICFTGKFLQLSRADAFWRRSREILMATALLQGALGVWGYNIPANQIAHVLGLAGPLLFMTLAVASYRRGFRPARYYIIAWGVLMAGIVTWVLAAYLPALTAAENYLLTATAAETILLSFALGDRVKILLGKEAVLQQNVQYYQGLSMTDELTCLYNRRYLARKMEENIAVAKQREMPLTLMLIDLDHFKFYNDQYGHMEGDKVLIRLGEVLLRVLDASQPAFRFGGEEFVVILPDMNCRDALQVADRIQRNLRDEVFSPAADVRVTVTVSIGIAELRWPNDSAESLFRRADEAMYKAKADGRNRAVCF